MTDLIIESDAPGARDAERSGSRPGRRFRPGRSLAWLVLALLVVISLFPFWWMLKVAITHNANVFGDFGVWPQSPTIVNFKRVLGLATDAEQQAEYPNQLIHLSFFLNLLNSVIFTAAVALGSVASSALHTIAP